MTLSVCLSVRDRIFGNTRPIFTNLLCMLSMAVARSSSGGVAIRYVLPVLWTTSYLHIMGHMPECRCNTGTASRCSTLYQVIPTKWPSYRDHRFCDVTPPYETYAWNFFYFRSVAVAEAASRKLVTLWCKLLQTVGKVCGLWLPCWKLWSLQIEYI